ncbi:hypothetical protein DRP04_03385 [Archaeoglobales archaeon]|nr:MAG: hypothetical protein DRP04_03385 [Archaeoglobales archaeon]
MGAIGAWIKVLAGFFILGGVFIFSQPMFDFMFAAGNAMGGNAANVASLIKTCLQVLPIPIAISLIIWGFIEATREEDASYFRYFR